ncbi:MAG TPA: hypothetical protein VMC79_02960, partial [Rectinemataceae bacterium]|nr:hypothetical protein [Rectinemataceae bacterium]
MPGTEGRSSSGAGAAGAAPDPVPGYWIVPHTHWDREWYLPFQEFRWKLLATLDDVIDTLEGDPDFGHFMLDGQTVALEDYLEFRPERRPQIEALVRSGRLAVGPWYVQPDDLLPTGEALVRNLERGLAIARSFGGAMMVGYLPDSFGHSGSLPDILRGFGIESACLMRGPGPEADRCLFSWCSQDGSAVLVAYLIDGYSNGADIAMEGSDTAQSLEELWRRQEDQGALVEGLPLLVMNGYDHRPIEARLTARLAEAGLLGKAARIGSLEGYLDRARAAAGGAGAAALPTLRGELRSTYRCPITAGCSSTRHWIKQEDQDVAALLERRAEPLAALAGMAAGVPWPDAALDAAWKFLLLNQAHDSICGCSIDSVHEDMRYRYAQARAIAAAVAESAESSLAALVGSSSIPDGDGSGFVVVNPGPARAHTLVSARIASLPPAAVVVGPAGQLFPVQILPGAGGGIFFDERFKPGQIKLALGLVRGGELMNYRITDASLREESATVIRVDLELSTARGETGFDWDAWLQTARPALERRGIEAVHAVGRRSGPSTLLFPAALPAFGAAAFRVRARQAGEAAPGAGQLTQGRNFIENEFYRISVMRNGSVELFDKGSGLRFAGLNAIVDGGDRGDEYNYDPPGSDRVVDAPAGPAGLPIFRRVRTHFNEVGPLRSSLLVEASYRLPLGLSADRGSRSRRRVSVTVKRQISLTAGSRRIEFHTEVDNPVSDHRLRLRFPLPGRCEAAEVGGSFE